MLPNAVLAQDTPDESASIAPVQNLGGRGSRGLAQLMVIDAMVTRILGFILAASGEKSEQGTRGFQVSACITPEFLSIQ